MTTDVTYDDLTDGQRKALDTCVENMKTDGKNHTIIGPAGSGKTLLTKFIYEEAKKKYDTESIILAAPTHQAAKVLGRTIGQEANTIHSILRISPTNYEDTAVFEQAEDAPDLSSARLIICDEASMYDRKLYDIILRSVPADCRIISVGDPYQLTPANEPSTSISRFFTDPDRFNRLVLKTVLRNSAPLLEVATAVRNGDAPYHNIDSNGYGVDMIKGGPDAVKEFLNRYFSIVKSLDDIENNRIVAYTNNSVDTFNRIVRKRLFETVEPFIVGETVVMQGPVIESFTGPDGKNRKRVVLNNGEHVRIIGIDKQAEIDIMTPKLYDSVVNRNVKFWELAVAPIDETVEGGKVIRVASSKTIKIRVLVTNEAKNDFYNLLSYMATEYKALTLSYKAAGKKVPWWAYWQAKDLFVDVKGLPASTVHKSQGSTFDNTFFYSSCMHCQDDAALHRQLNYVALTRSRNTTHYL